MLLSNEEAARSGNKGTNESREGTVMTRHTQRAPGASFGVGSLPHRETADAVDFAWRSTDIVTIPSLPRRSPAELMVPQALAGIEGITSGQYGGIAVDLDALDLAGEVVTDLASDSYAGFAAFLDSARERAELPPLVKWQFVGPLTLAFALVRSGLAVEVAAPLAQQAVRCHVRALQDEVARAMPGTTQIVVFDEPLLHDALVPDFPVSPDEVLDFVSGALAAVDTSNVSGVHSCAETDWHALLSIGAHIISVPVPSASDGEQMAALAAATPRIVEHLEMGGHIAWGAIRTDGPIAATADRSWKNLAAVMCALVKQGVDPLLVRRNCFVTPANGLDAHSVSVAERVFSHTRDLASRIADQATASLLTLGS